MAGRPLASQLARGPASLPLLRLFAPHCSARPPSDAFLRDTSPWFCLSAKDPTSPSRSFTQQTRTVHLQGARCWTAGVNKSGEGSALRKPSISKRESRELQIGTRAVTWGWRKQPTWGQRVREGLSGEILGEMSIKG